MASFDYDLFVIGAGSGGVRAARVAAGLGARVAIAEEDRVGGTCVIRGCVPKKLFVTASHFAEAFEDAAGFGWTVEGLRFDWPTLVANVAADVEWLSGIYVRNLEKSGAELIRSRAVLEDAHRIRLGADGRTVTAGTILIATGGAPSVERAIPGIEHTITSNDVFHLERLPERILVMGGGYIAVEFAGVFNGLGSETHLVCRADNVLRNFDDEVRQWVRAGMERHGIEVVSGDMIAAVERNGGNLVAVTDKGRRIEVDQVLMALGRKPASRGMGLEEVGVAIDHDGAIRVDALSKTSVDNIYAVGDVTNRKLLTPVAIREGAAFAETVFGGKPMEVDYDLIPTAVFSQPEVGTVGLTEDRPKPGIRWSISIAPTSSRCPTALQSGMSAC